SADAEYHWHACRLCEDQAHATDRAKHDFDESGVCADCGYRSVRGTWQNGACTLTLTDAIETPVYIFAASYEDGAAVDSAELGSVPVTLSGDTVKVFFLDPVTFEPLRPCVILK
ncbi:MAG: hypothetical protein IJ042_04350, partial [Butyricicoccus sp.]|nr:hypothetical protein [Butyricicoccus sp.]